MYKRQSAKLRKSERQEAERLIQHYREEVMKKEILSGFPFEDFENIVKITKHSGLGVLTAIQASFCIGFDVGKGAQRMNRMETTEKRFLSKVEAEEIFNVESVYLDGGNVIPCYRLAEMFGEWIKEFARKRLTSGNDCNAWGDCHERPMIYFLYKSGFMKVVAEHNYRLMAKGIKENGINGEIVKI